MQIVAVFNPAMVTSDTFAVPQNNGKMVVWNESSISLMFSFQNGSTAYVPAWTAVLFCGPWGNVNVTWDHQAVLSSSSPPLSQVVVEVYDTNEMVPGTFPMPLTRQTNVGNNVAVGTATTVVNDNNVSGTQVVEATVAGDPQSAVSLLNNGKLVLGTAVNNGFFEVIGAFGNVSINGNGVLTVDNRILCNLIIAETGNDLTLDVANGHKIALQVNNSDVVDITGSAVTLIGLNLVLPNNTPLRFLDNSSVAHDILYVDSANEVAIQQAVNTQKIFFKDPSGNNLASIDSSGNMRLKGSLTQNTTP